MILITRKEFYDEWQELMVEEVPVAPTVYRYKLTAINKRIANFSIEPGTENVNPWKWGVTEEESVK